MIAAARAATARCSRDRPVWLALGLLLGCPASLHLPLAAAAGTATAAGASAGAAAPREPRGPAPAPAPAAVTTEMLSHGRFTHLTLLGPGTGTPTRLVLLLSDMHGFDARARVLAGRLAAGGALVAGIDLPELERSFAHDGDDCAFVDGDLENLSHFIQAYRRLPGYSAPWLAGEGSGATLAYAVLAQAPPHTFAGAVTVGFCPQMRWRVPLCADSGLKMVAADKGLRISTAPALAEPWVSIEEQGASCPSAELIAGVRGAARVTVSDLDAPRGPGPHALAALDAAFASLGARTSVARVPPAPAALGDLPVIEVPAQPIAGTSPNLFAVLLSGDGGWAGLDKGVAEALSAAGVTTVGLDSLRYFWSARTPEGLAGDLDRLIRHYLPALGKERVLLIGYSQGANVLPFALTRLPPATREHIALAALLGLSAHALFEFHLSSWLSDAGSGPSTAAEIGRLDTTPPVLCLYGEDERDSPCPTLDPTRVRSVKLAGGHHFNGDYADLAQLILRAASVTEPAPGSTR